MEDKNQILDLNKIIVEGETIIWSGKPQKKAYVLQKFFAFLPIAIIWALFDICFIVNLAKFNVMDKMLWFFIPFFAIHLFPVWIWVSNIITANKKWKKTQYAATDKRIIIQTGFLGINSDTIYYTDIKNVRLKISFIGKSLGVGSIFFDTALINSVQQIGITKVFRSIENAQEIYMKLQKIVLDIQTDIHYPNQLRPDINPGYNTKYDDKSN